MDIHGFRVTVHGWPEVVEQARLDFAWFCGPDAGSRGGANDVEVIAEDADPDYARFDPVAASFVTPRNVVHQHGPLTVIDYFGKALSVFDRGAGRLVVQGRDEHLVHEAVYQFVLSQAGAALEARGLVRLHSLGLVGRSGAVAVMLPSGGGKSTLALRALRDDRVRLLSEDSPLLDRRGRLHPFPLRLGVNVGDADALPAGRTRRIERMEFHPKLVLELDAFADRIAAGPAELRDLVIGRRTLGTGAALEKLPRRAAVGTLLREAVVGVGVYQGMEFVLQQGLRDVLGQAGPAVTRAACCAAALRGSSVWRLTLGRDREANWRALEPLLVG
ncbi:MAG: hypothetical protein ACRDL1_12530 [Solirubrobacterales bacterium]